MGLGMEGGHKHRAASCEVFVFSGILGGCFGEGFAEHMHLIGNKDAL